MSRLSARVTRIMGHNPGPFTLTGSCTYLLGTQRARVLIDTGDNTPAAATTKYLEDLRRVLTNAPYSEERPITVSHIIISHYHHDHIGGVPGVLALLKDLYARADWRKSDQPPMPEVWKFPLQDEDYGFPIQPLKDGQIINIDEDTTLKVHHTPGHTKDHACFSLPQEQAIFCADAILGQGSAVFEDYTSYIKSLHGLEAAALALCTAINRSVRLYCGHGPVVDEGAEKIQEYLKHRRDRELQVLAALANGPPPKSPDELTAIVYKGTPANLMEAAKGNLVQALSKLELHGEIMKTADGKFQLQGGKASL